MNRKKYVFTVALTQTFLMTFGLLNSAAGQDDSIIRALPEISYRVSSRLGFQDPVPTGSDPSTQDVPRLNQPVRPDQQVSPSDQVVQDPDNSLKSLQTLDDKSLDQELADETIASLFKKGEWPRKGIGEINLDICESSGKAPEEIAGKLMNSLTGQWSVFNPAPKTFCWAAPDIRYQPLYFEDVPLERYGQTRGTNLQTVKSGVHFFTSIALLPSHMRHDHPGNCDYPLGFCRPGDDVPYTIQRQLYGHSGR